MSEVNPTEYGLSDTHVPFLRACLKRGHLAFRDREHLDYSRRQMDYRFRVLEREGLITVEKEDPAQSQHGGHPQRVAELTPTGEAVITRWLETNPVDVETIQAAGEEAVTRDHLEHELSEQGILIDQARRRATEAGETAEMVDEKAELHERYIMVIARELDLVDELVKVKRQYDYE
ncbi:uncharacterized protein Nmag_0238 [Natrialba magadii ATCC 43099]|uniref:Uncharacterized protein n=1 Tax=Natrialba magadii (strain ATCC 43099 / DSM 3394 / CCM 3739 / CIP 104546 / IAM 13178 / JCM 8861 / NBRC 102185 / NCIMB 2190 / MS3) TaxID=547559 RepID=D3SX10_NATMM|nr:hypothetical protein [Natrialba magadii]ADD03830.1 uncharacterized protein Nmag_0238 [Natrialba magadii ATCC 43099]ELY33493.1 hypothetical protein C500_01635 [Natrialba magadii ATCC 43099]